MRQPFIYLLAVCQRGSIFETSGDSCFGGGSAGDSYDGYGEGERESVK